MSLDGGEPGPQAAGPVAWCGLVWQLCRRDAASAAASRHTALLVVQPAHLALLCNAGSHVRAFAPLRDVLGAALAGPCVQLLLPSSPPEGGPAGAEALLLDFGSADRAAELVLALRRARAIGLGAPLPVTPDAVLGPAPVRAPRDRRASGAIPGRAPTTEEVEALLTALRGEEGRWAAAGPPSAALARAVADVLRHLRPSLELEAAVRAGRAQLAAANPDASKPPPTVAAARPSHDRLRRAREQTQSELRDLHDAVRQIRARQELMAELNSLL